MEKMKINQKIITIALLLLYVSNVHAQEASNQTEYHLGITLFDEHVATPFGAKSDSPTYLGGTISFEMSKRRGGVYQFTHIFQAGYYYHQDFNQVAFLAWKPKFELRFANTFNVNTILGIGYAHSFPTQTSFGLEDGRYQKKTNWGKPHAMPSIGFGAGLHLDKLLDVPIELFGRYEVFSLAPYAPKGSIPLTLNTMTSFGIKYSFN
jgi:hypothetical protein